MQNIMLRYGIKQKSQTNGKKQSLLVNNRNYKLQRKQTVRRHYQHVTTTNNITYSTYPVQGGKIPPMSSKHSAITSPVQVEALHVTVSTCNRKEQFFFSLFKGRGTQSQFLETFYNFMEILYN